MKRRDFLFAVAFVVPTSHAIAEQRSTLKRVAMVHPVTKPGDMRIGGDPNYAILFEEMQRLGYVEGVNMIVDRYSAEGQFDRYGERAGGRGRPDLGECFARHLVPTHAEMLCNISDRGTLDSCAGVMPAHARTGWMVVVVVTVSGL